MPAPAAATPSRQAVARLQADLEAAIALHQGGQLDDAEKAYASILEKAPGQPDALNLLGVVQSEKNRNDAAIELLSRAAKLRPKDANILNNLGRACVRARRFEQAIDALEHAMALAPELVESYGNLVHAHRAVGNEAEARYYVGALRRLNGGSVTADYEEARLFSDLGDKDAARARYEKITKEHPQFAVAWTGLARLATVKPDDPMIDRVVKAIESAKEPSATLKHLCYAAGKIFDDIGEYDRAFEHLLRAKRQDPDTYDHDRTRKQFKALKKTFNRDFYAARPHFGVSSKRPVFIVGMPRSGTTLAEQILASHPDVFGGGELEFVSKLTSSVSEYVAAGRHPEAARDLGPDVVAAFAFQYLRKIAALDPTAARVTDKMPHNFMSLGLLRVMFRDLKVVHCVRHPFDTCLSCFTHDFTHSHAYNRSLEGLASYYQAYRELMEYWTERFGDVIHTLQYERMLADQEGESRKLLEFNDLEWNDAVLDFSGTQRRVATPSSWQVRRPLFQSSGGRWKNYARHLEPALSTIDERFFPS